jgi:hypothetical protein
VRAAVLDQAALLAQESQELGLQIEPAVIRADGNLEVLHGYDASLPLPAMN